MQISDYLPDTLYMLHIIPDYVHRSNI